MKLQHCDRTGCPVACSLDILGAFTRPEPIIAFGMLSISIQGFIMAYLYLTGFISAFIVLSITFLIPILGARKLVILSLTGQLLMAMIVSHFGALESPLDPVNFKKVIGAVLLIMGAIVSVS